MGLLRCVCSSLVVAALLNSAVLVDDSFAARKDPKRGISEPKRTNRHMITVDPAALEGGDSPHVASALSVPTGRARFKALQEKGQNLVRGVLGGSTKEVATTASAPSKVRGLLSTPTTFVATDLTDEQVATLKGTEGIKEVSPVYTFVVELPGGSILSPSEPSNVPTPLFNRYQWGIENTGNLRGSDVGPDGNVVEVVSKADVDADISSAWQLSIGSGDIVVAVIDTGIDRAHTNLKTNLYYRTTEIEGNKIDDDQNGYVDDVNGVQTTKRNGDIKDLYGHGTHVSGILAASPRSDGDTMTGTAPQVRLLTVGTGYSCNDTWCFDSDDLLEAYRYVLANKRAGVNIRVLNLSLGGPCSAISQEMKDVIKDIVDAGITVVASAGNSGLNNDRYPTCPASVEYPGIISVGNVGMDGKRHWSSNYGSASVDVAAPGGLIYSTIPGGLYGYLSGTSQAAPLVAGVAALMLSVNPTLTPKQVQSLLIDNAKPLSDFPLVSGGMVSAPKALTAAAQLVVSGVIKKGDKGLKDVAVTMTVGSTKLTATTDAWGYFFIPRPPVGASYSLSFVKPLFSFSDIASPNDKVSTLQRFTISAARETRKVSGVVSVNGKPVAGARVGAYAEFPDNEQFKAEATTDARGAYVVAVPLNNRFFLHPSYSGVQFSTKSDGYIANSDMTVNFAGNHQAISVTGSIGVDGRLASDIGGVASLQGSAPGGAAVSLTAPVRAGRFEFTSKSLVAGGTYSISLSNFNKSYGSVSSASITPSASISVGLKATKVQSARNVIGQITRKGAPLVGATIAVFELVPSPTQPKPGQKKGDIRVPKGSGKTNAQGGFSIPITALPGAKIEVVAELDGLSFPPVGVVTPATGDISVKLSAQ